MELEALQKVLQDIEELGATLVAVSPQLQKYSKQVVKKHGLSFPVLADPDNRVASQFGLTFTLPDYLQKIYQGFGIDLPRFNGNDKWQLPIPGRFIIGRDGLIKDAEVHPDYTRRPEPKETVKILKRLHS